MTINKHELLGVPKHANQHRLSRLTMESHTDELRIMASAVENYTDELIAALEAAEKRIAELSSNNDSAHKALLKARRRTVTLPTGYSVRPGHPINETERSVMIPKDGGAWLSRFDVEHALRVAGLSIKGE
ncbi:hypothetical protein [Atlantibacter subterraneus]|uniref:hypothetical protein n=1 Tax=Atlantibacter subterraneus TaxID=255519 RepID=UPI0022EA64CE|nr:hypothetical protein [Atlantibacter subterranea]MDA3133596.1 hypothetical protein [Atlantibacter subterranea]